MEALLRIGREENEGPGLARKVQDKMADILEKLVALLPTIREAMADTDVGLSVSDCEKVIYYNPGRTLDLKVPSGAPLREGMVLMDAIRQQKRIARRQEKDIWGIPFIATALPVKEEGRVVGAISFQTAVARQDALKDMANKLMDNINLLASTSEEVTAQTQEMAAVTRGLAEMSQESQKRTQDTGQVLALIRNVAGQTNLLGLNAAIEAARVGEAGRGFGVVAEEIRKLATSSSESIQKIDGILKAVATDSDRTYEEIQRISGNLAQVAQAVSGIAEAVQEALAVAQELDGLANKLAGE